MMKGKEDGGKRRTPYQKPQVEQVELRPEEAVLGECKNFEDPGPEFTPCLPATVQCLDFGS